MEEKKSTTDEKNLRTEIHDVLLAFLKWRFVIHARPAQYIRTGEAYDDLWRKRVQEARAGGGAREKGSMPRISRRPGIWPMSWEKRNRVKKWG